MSVRCQDEFDENTKTIRSAKENSEVADRLFYTEGVRATGTEKIMFIAEVAKATFYRHFESKYALLRRIPRKPRSSSLGLSLSSHSPKESA